MSMDPELPNFRRPEDLFKKEETRDSWGYDHFGRFYGGLEGGLGGPEFNLGTSRNQGETPQYACGTDEKGATVCSLLPPGTNTPGSPNFMGPPAPSRMGWLTNLLPRLGGAAAGPAGGLIGQGLSWVLDRWGQGDSSATLTNWLAEHAGDVNLNDFRAQLDAGGRGNDAVGFGAGPAPGGDGGGGSGFKGGADGIGVVGGASFQEYFNRLFADGAPFEYFMDRYGPGGLISSPQPAPTTPTKEKGKGKGHKKNIAMPSSSRLGPAEESGGAGAEQVAAADSYRPTTAGPERTDDKEERARRRRRLEALDFGRRGYRLFDSQN